MNVDKLNKAFESLKKEDLQQIIRTLNKDYYIGQTIDREIQKILTADTINSRVIDEGLQAIKDVQKALANLEDVTRKYPYGIQLHDNEVNRFLKLLKTTLENVLPSFIKNKMCKEGVRLLCAIVTVVDTSSSSEIDDLSDEIDFDPYYEKLIQKGNLDEDEVLSFRDKYEGKINISPKDIFTSDDISL